MFTHDRISSSVPSGARLDDAIRGIRDVRPNLMPPIAATQKARPESAPTTETELSCLLGNSRLSLMLTGPSQVQIPPQLYPPPRSPLRSGESLLEMLPTQIGFCRGGQRQTPSRRHTRMQMACRPRPRINTWMRRRGLRLPSAVLLAPPARCPDCDALASPPASSAAAPSWGAPQPAPSAAAPSCGAPQPAHVAELPLGGGRA